MLAREFLSGVGKNVTFSMGSGQRVHTQGVL